MKKMLFILLLSAAVLSAYSVQSSAAVYEASGLHNAVGRSETVQDLFFERWQTILDRQLYVDAYGKINWLNNFKINSVVRTGVDSYEKKAVDMTLVRSYGSLTINYPVLGGYDAADVQSRLSKGSSQPEDQKDAEEAGGGLWKPKNLQVAFTATGFHYGLTSKTTVDRGTAGSDTVTDYKYTQFFDDMFTLSLIYTPYVYVHGGLLMNNQVDPNDDGTMSYFNTKDDYPQFRWFFASNLLSFFNTNATMTKDNIEKIAAGTEVVKLVEMLTKVPKAVPRLTITYKQLMLYNDEPYDAVWVKTVKTDTTPDDQKQHAKLHTLSFLVTENLGDIFFADFFAEYQYCPVRLIEKRTVYGGVGETLKLRKTREMRGSVGINFLGFMKEKRNDALKLSLGMGQYWDPAIAVHRSNGSGYAVLGGYGTLAYEHPFAGMELTVSYNYSKEIRKLVESTDKLALEGSMYFRF